VAIGAPRVAANLTNAVALCPGYFGGTYAQRADLGGDRARLRRLAVAGGLGGLTGSILLLSTGEAVFKQIVPWLILLACALLLHDRMTESVLPDLSQAGLLFEQTPPAPVGSGTWGKVKNGPCALLLLPHSAGAIAPTEVKQR
jgi:uncharacterized membrane protein YfcA